MKSLLQRVPFIVPLAALLLAMGLSALGDGWLMASGLVASAAIVRVAYGFKSDIHSVLERRRWHPLWIFILLAGLSLGLLTYYKSIAPDSEAVQPDHYISGVVEQRTSMTQGDRLLVSADRFANADGRLARPFRLYIYTGVTDFSPGDRISFPDDISWYEEDIYLSADYASILRHRGVLGKVSAPVKFVTLTPGDPEKIPSALRLKDRLFWTIHSSEADLDTRTVLEMLLIGDKTHCDPEIKSRLALSGMAHIFALSGMHLFIISGILLWLMLPLNLILPSKVRWMLVVPLVWAYCYVVGFPWSVVRAAIMFSLMVLARILERGNASGNALCAAAFIILALTPEAIGDAGFQLSFFSLLCLMAYSDALYSVDRRKHPARFRILSFLLTMTVAAGGTWAIAAYHFGFFSLGFAVSGILVLPLLPVYMTAGIVYLVCLLLGFDPALLRAVVEVGAHGVVALSEWLGGAQQAVIHLRPHPLTVVLWTLGILLLGWHFSLRRYIIENPSRPDLRGRRYLLPAVALSLATIGLIIVPFTSEAETVPPRIMVWKGLYRCNISFTGRAGQRVYCEPRPGLTTSMRYFGKRVVYIDENRHSSRSRRRLPLPAAPTSCDILIVGNGCRASLEDLLCYYRPSVMIDGRKSESAGPSLHTDARKYGIRVVDIYPDEKFVLSIYDIVR